MIKISNFELKSCYTPKKRAKLIHFKYPNKISKIFCKKI